jgi:predicted membrane channel-forming protein YqfA (hemolysin III family)
MTHQEQNEQTHTVRPRWTWIALIVMVAGLVLIAVGIVAQTWAWAVPGLVLLAVGGIAGLYGGFFYDVQGGASAGGQLHDAVENNEHEFPGAGTRRSEGEVKRDVRRRWLRGR